jgi:hypothetical protein
MKNVSPDRIIGLACAIGALVVFIWSFIEFFAGIK